MKNRTTPVHNTAIRYKFTEKYSHVSLSCIRCDLEMTLLILRVLVSIESIYS